MKPSTHRNQRFFAYQIDDNGHGRTVLLDAIGHRAMMEFMEFGPSVTPEISYLGTPNEAGLWIWEGTLRVEVLRVAGEEDDYDVFGEGTWRRPTGPELEALATGKVGELFTDTEELDPGAPN